MSNYLQLFVSSNHHSKPIQRLLSLKPTMDISIGTHDQQHQQQEQEVDMEEPEAEERLHSPSSSSSSSSSSTSTTTTTFSTSSSSCTEVVSNNNIKGLDEVDDIAKEAAAVDNINVFDVVGDGDDGGYHTPTSPRRRIPAAIECPRAPKKPLLRLHKKRSRDEEARRRGVVEVEDVELIFCAERIRTAKKPREDRCCSHNII